MDQYRHVQLHIKALKLCSIWFYIAHSKKSLKFWINFLIKCLLLVFVFIVPTSGQIVYLIKLIVSGKAEIQEIAGITNLILTELMTSLKLLDMTLRHNLFMKLVKQMNSIEFTSKDSSHTLILASGVKISRLLFWSLFIGSTFDIIVHVIVVPASHRFQKLPLKMDLVFFDVNDASYFKYVFAYQIMYKPVMLTSFVVLQTLPWAAMSCAISQLNVLIHKLENMKRLVKEKTIQRQCNENEAFKMIFNACALHHKFIIRYANTLQDTFSGQFFGTLFISACVIGTTIVQILSIEAPLKNLSVLTWMLTYVFVFVCTLFVECFFGNSITAKSMHVATVVYSCPWINLSNEIKRNIVIFIANAQRPIVMRASKLMPVSMESFGKVMNWTYKGFAVMNQMKN